MTHTLPCGKCGADTYMSDYWQRAANSVGVFCSCSACPDCDAYHYHQSTCRLVVARRVTL